MERSNWSSLVRSISTTRSGKALFFKPVCVVAAIDLAAEHRLAPDNIDAEEILRRFSDYVTPFFRDRGNDGYQPLWHLSNNKLWTFFKEDRALSAKEISSGRPGSKKRLFERFDRIAIHEEVKNLWASPDDRKALRGEMLLMLQEGDRDSRQLVPPLFDPQYLLDRDRWPSQETLNAYLAPFRQPSLFDNAESTMWLPNDEHEDRGSAELTAYPIPPQGVGPQFKLGPSGKIELIPATELDGSGNNVSRLAELLPLIRQAADDVVSRINRNVFPELARDAAAYRAAVSDDAGSIAWGVVFGRGLMLENAAAAAQRQIEDRLKPALEDAPQAALASLLALHGPLILATATGRELHEQATSLQMTRDEQVRLRADAQALAADLQQSPEVIEHAESIIVSEAADAIGQGRHPESGTVFGSATVKHVIIILISAAVVGAPVAVAGLLGSPISWVGYEAIKRTKFYQEATSSLGGSIDEAVRNSEEAARRQAIRLAPFRRFVTQNEKSLRSLATTMPQSSWMLRYINFIVGSNPSSASDP